MLIDLNDRGHVRQRESQSLEFKRSFRAGDSVLEYLRTLVGMANNGGGSIVFGVSDNPRVPVGLQDERFSSFDAKNINKRLLEYFSADVEWSPSIIHVDGVELGVITVTKAEVRPVVCIRNHEGKNLREGAIYYRYRGETREIKPNELLTLLQTERDKERELWMQHVKAIGSIGPQAAHILDLKNRSITLGDSKVVIEESLLNKIKIIKEGHFKEQEGAPTLRLLGDIDGVLGEDGVVLNEASYPYTESTLLEKLPIGQYVLRALVWHLEVKGNSKYHMAIPTGRSGCIHKYSNAFLMRVREIIRSEEDVLQEAVAAYRARRRA